MLLTGRFDMETPIVVLLVMWRAGIPIMTLNGKSQIMSDWVGRLLKRVERFTGANWLEFLDKNAQSAVRKLVQRCSKYRAQFKK